MRDALVHREFEHLGVDHDEAALLGPELIEKREHHGVDGHRFSGPRGSGDQQMRHAGQIDDHRRAADVLAERETKLATGLLEGGRGEQLAQAHGLAAYVGKLESDHVAPRNDGDAHRHRAHGTRDIIGEPDDARSLGARRRFEFVKGDHGSRTHLDDLSADTEVV